MIRHGNGPDAARNVRKDAPNIKPWAYWVVGVSEPDVLSTENHKKSHAHSIDYCVRRKTGSCFLCSFLQCLLKPHSRFSSTKMNTNNRKSKILLDFL